MASSSDLRTDWQAGFPYQQMVEDILSGRLAPGSKIDFADLMRRYFTSTTDLHEAIIRLSNEGLAILDGPAALRIAPVSVADLEDLTATRLVIESEALVRSVRAGEILREHVRLSAETLADGIADGSWFGSPLLK